MDAYWRLGRRTTVCRRIFCSVGIGLGFLVNTCIIIAHSGGQDKIIYLFILVESKKMQKNKEVMGAVTEHWLDKRIRENKPTKLEGNVPRISAENLVRLNAARNEMLGTSYSIHDWMRQIADNDPDYREKRKTTSLRRHSKNPRSK